MIVGRKYLNDDVFFTVFKKHFCPTCKVRLERIKVSKIVNSQSPEAKNDDFTSAEGFYVGDVKFIWKEFMCPSCGEHFTVNQVKCIEKEQKKLNLCI